jgi:hypothetical protein
MFVSAIGGTEPDITDDNARDLWFLSGEFRLRTLSRGVVVEVARSGTLLG